MLSHIKQKWNELKVLPPGTRFQAFYKQQKDKSRWVKLGYLAFALVAFALGVVFAFIPGPAVLFFALCAAALATQSLWVARWLDRAEVKGRELWASFRAWWQRHRSHGAGPGPGSGKIRPRRT